MAALGMGFFPRRLRRREASREGRFFTIRG